jgi:Tfp pilus assembly protein PilF
MDRIEKLKEFIKLDPSDCFLQHALALEYVKAGDDAIARKLFEDLLERQPSYIGSYYHLAKLFERNGDNSSAIKWYQRGMEEAKKAEDLHVYNELKSAYEELVI